MFKWPSKREKKEGNKRLKISNPLSPVSARAADRLCPSISPPHSALSIDCSAAPGKGALPLGSHPFTDPPGSPPVTAYSTPLRISSCTTSEHPPPLGEADGRASPPQASGYTIDLGSVPDLSLTSPQTKNLSRAATLELSYDPPLRGDEKTTKKPSLFRTMNCRCLSVWLSVVTLLSIAAMGLAIYTFLKLQSQGITLFPGSSETKTQTLSGLNSTTLGSMTSIMTTSAPSESTTELSALPTPTLTRSSGRGFAFKSTTHMLESDSSTSFRKSTSTKSKDGLDGGITLRPKPTTRSLDDIAATDLAEKRDLASVHVQATCKANHKRLLLPTSVTKRYCKSHAERVSVPSFIRLLTSLLLFVDVRAYADSLIVPASVPATITSDVPLHIPTPNHHTKRFLDKVKDIGKDVKSEAEQLKTKAEEVKTKAEEVKTKAESVADKAQTAIASVASEVKDALFKWDFPDIEPIDSYTTALSPELRRGVTSDAKRERNIDQLPFWLFNGWIMWCIYIGVGVWVILIIAVPVAIYIMIKPFIDLLGEINKHWDTLKNVKDLVGDKLEEVKNDVEKHLKEFWKDVIDNSIFDNMEKIQQWIVDVLTQPLEKFIGGPIDFKTMPFGKKKKGFKRDVPLLETSAHVEQRSPWTTPIALDIPIEYSSKFMSLLTGAGLGFSEITKSTSPATVTDVSTTVSHTVMPTPAIISEVSISLLPAANSNVSSVGLTGGASQLSILPLFAVLARSLKPYKVSRAVFQRDQAPNDPWQAYYQIRSMVMHHCITVDGHDDALAEHTQKQLFCGLRFASTFPELRQQHGCVARHEYDKALERVEEFCKGSYELVKSADASSDSNSAGARSRDQLCELVESFREGKPGYGVEECSSMKGSASATTDVVSTATGATVNDEASPPADEAPAAIEGASSRPKDSSSAADEASAPTDEASSPAKKTSSMADQDPTPTAKDASKTADEMSPITGVSSPKTDVTTDQIKAAADANADVDAMADNMRRPEMTDAGMPEASDTESPEAAGTETDIVRPKATDTGSVGPQISSPKDDTAGTRPASKWGDPPPPVETDLGTKILEGDDGTAFPVPASLEAEPTGK